MRLDHLIMTQACGPVFNLIAGGSTKNPLGTRIFDLGALEFYWFACSPEKTDVQGMDNELWNFTEIVAILERRIILESRISAYQDLASGSELALMSVQCPGFRARGTKQKRRIYSMRCKRVTWTQSMAILVVFSISSCSAGMSFLKAQNERQPDERMAVRECARNILAISLP